MYPKYIVQQMYTDNVVMTTSLQSNEVFDNGMFIKCVILIFWENNCIGRLFYCSRLHENIHNVAVGHYKRCDILQSVNSNLYSKRSIFVVP